jgi:hypothetical protein
VSGFDKAREGAKKKGLRDRLGTISEFGIPYLHFDFVVTTRVRELGHFTTADGFGGRFKNILPHSKPAEVRANNNKRTLDNYFILKFIRK